MLIFVILIIYREAPKEEAADAMDADESTLKSNGSFKKQKYAN